MPRVRVELLTGARSRALLESLPPYDPDQAWTIGTRLREQGAIKLFFTVPSLAWAEAKAGRKSAASQRRIPPR